MRQPTTFGYGDEHRPSFVFVLLLNLIVLAVALSGCTSAAQRKLIDSVNEAQLAAAQTYDDAKAKEGSAEVSCKQALVARGIPLPQTADAISPTCASVGVPMPYDPIKLALAAGPVNALYDVVRAANDARVKGIGCTPDAPCDIPAATVGTLLGAFDAVIADLAQAGIVIPQKVTDIVTVLKQSQGGQP